MVTLTVYRGDRIVQELDLEGPEIRIGRGADNSVVLPDDGKGVSRAHAVLRLENGSPVLYDRESQNGTFLEGKRIKRAVIQPGQDIVIGPYRLVVMSFDATDPDPGATGTVITPRTTPLPAATPSALASPPDPTPRDIPPAPAQHTPSTGVTPCRHDRARANRADAAGAGATATCRRLRRGGNRPRRVGGSVDLAATAGYKDRPLGYQGDHDEHDDLGDHHDPGAGGRPARRNARSSRERNGRRGRYVRVKAIHDSGNAIRGRLDGVSAGTERRATTRSSDRLA